MKRIYACNLQLVANSPILYRIMAYPPTYEEIKQMPGVDSKEPKIFINDCWYLDPAEQHAKMFLADTEKSDSDKTFALSYENHSSISLWYNQNGKYYGEVKITGQPVRVSITRLPNKENIGGDCQLELFGGRFDDIGHNIHPDDDPIWQTTFMEKMSLVTQLGLNNNLNLYTNTEIKHGHLEIYFKPF